LCTITIPFLTAALRTRFRAQDTLWPASAVVTAALVIGTCRNVSQERMYCALPLTLHALDGGCLPVSIGIRAKPDVVAGLDYPTIDDSIHDRADIRYGPHLGDRILDKVVRNILCQSESEKEPQMAGRRRISRHRPRWKGAG
jgi:hypothetical protein